MIERLAALPIIFKNSARNAAAAITEKPTFEMCHRIRASLLLPLEGLSMQLAGGALRRHSQRYQLAEQATGSSAFFPKLPALRSRLIRAHMELLTGEFLGL